MDLYQKSQNIESFWALEVGKASPTNTDSLLTMSQSLVLDPLSSPLFFASDEQDLINEEDNDKEEVHANDEHQQLLQPSFSSSNLMFAFSDLSLASSPCSFAKEATTHLATAGDTTGPARVELPVVTAEGLVATATTSASTRPASIGNTTSHENEEGKPAGAAVATPATAKEDEEQASLLQHHQKLHQAPPGFCGYLGLAGGATRLQNNLHLPNINSTVRGTRKSSILPPSCLTKTSWTTTTSATTTTIAPGLQKNNQISKTLLPLNPSMRANIWAPVVSLTDSKKTFAAAAAGTTTSGFSTLSSSSSLSSLSSSLASASSSEIPFPFSLPLSRNKEDECLAKVLLPSLNTITKMPVVDDFEKDKQREEEDDAGMAGKNPLEEIERLKRELEKARNRIDEMETQRGSDRVAMMAMPGLGAPPTSTGTAVGFPTNRGFAVPARDYSPYGGPSFGMPGLGGQGRFQDLFQSNTSNRGGDNSPIPYYPSPNPPPVAPVLYGPSLIKDQTIPVSPAPPVLQLSQQQQHKQMTQVPPAAAFPDPVVTANPTTTTSNVTATATMWVPEFYAPRAHGMTAAAAAAAAIGGSGNGGQGQQGLGMDGGRMMMGMGMGGMDMMMYEGEGPAVGRGYLQGHTADAASAAGTAGTAGGDGECVGVVMVEKDDGEQEDGEEQGATRTTTATTMPPINIPARSAYNMGIGPSAAPGDLGCTNGNGFVDVTSVGGGCEEWFGARRGGVAAGSGDLWATPGVAGNMGMFVSGSVNPMLASYSDSYPGCWPVANNPGSVIVGNGPLPSQQQLPAKGLLHHQPQNGGQARGSPMSGAQDVYYGYANGNSSSSSSSIGHNMKKGGPKPMMFSGMAGNGEYECENGFNDVYYNIPINEPINYRRLLEKSATCDWRIIVNRIVHDNDQQASIFLQQKLKISNSEQRNLIIECISEQSYSLMVNRFGNFLIQRCLEYSNKAQIDALTGPIKGRVCALSKDPFGCHVVQKALDCVGEEMKHTVVAELLESVAETMVHRYACHVWQKLFELRWTGPAPRFMARVNEELRGMWERVALEETGSLVVQNIFENCTEEDKRPCVEEIVAKMDVVICGQWGNWVIQHMVECAAEPVRERVVALVLDKSPVYSTDQYASKVVEKLLKMGDKAVIQRFLDKVTAQRHGRPRIPLIDIASDAHGNYLVQYILQSGTPAQQDEVAGQIRKHMVSLRGSKWGSKCAWLIDRNRANTSVTAVSKSLLKRG